MQYRSDYGPVFACVQFAAEQLNYRILPFFLSLADERGAVSEGLDRLVFVVVLHRKFVVSFRRQQGGAGFTVFHGGGDLFDLRLVVLAHQVCGKE